MKKTAFTVIFLYIVALLCVPVSGAAYTDDMDGFVSDSIKQYSGLTQHSFGRGASVVPDATAATFSSGHLLAHAQYRADGATSVTAAIYSHSGTFVCRDPETADTHMMGVFRENMDFAMGVGLQQALYCAPANAVYTYEGGLKQMYTNRNTYYFGSIITPPSGELIGYGVNIYYSFDGRSFIRAQVRMISLEFDTSNGYCYERYTASIPESVKYIRVEINDVTTVPLEGGEAMPKEKKLQTALASVMLSGDRLVMGEPEAIMPTMPPNISQNMDGSYYSARRKDDLGEASSETEEPAKAVSESKEASSKFEGTITSSSPSKSSRASSSESAKKDVSELPEPTSSEASSQDEITPDETIVYDIRRAPEETGFNSGITAYIIIVSGVILTLAVLPKRK